MSKSKSSPIRSRFHINKVILIIILVLLIPLGLYLYSNKINSLNKSITPGVNNLDISNWLTFTSEIYPTQSTGVNPIKPLPASTQFTLKYPNGWQVKESSNSGIFLELTKSDRILSVRIFGQPQLCDSQTGWTVIKDFQSQIGILRRVANNNHSEVMSDRKGYIICSNEPGYQISGFSTHTSLGYITFDVPISASNPDVEEMDQIISTIQKIK